MIYETSWSRQIGLLLGQTANSAAVVLSSYFAGLAMGYYVGGRWASRLSPLWAYGVAELFAAVWACLIPQFLSWMTTPELAGWLGEMSFQMRFAFHAISCFLLLLPATVAMGTTLPLMAEFLSPKSRLSTGRVALAYGLNTLGAVLGVLSSFALLVMIGVKASSYVAAAISAACGLGAFALASLLPMNKSVFQQSASPLSIKTPATSFPFRWWEIVAGVSGFCTLALEMLYTRMFSLVFHNSTYTFGAIVAVFLVALALGAFSVSFIHHRVRPEKILPICSYLAAIGILLSAVGFLRKTQLEYFHVGDSFAEYLLGRLGLVGLLALPVGVMAGMIYPLLGRWSKIREPWEVGCWDD